MMIRRLLRYLLGPPSGAYLSAQSIRRRCVGALHPTRGWIPPLVAPFCERTVSPRTGMSYGLSACSYDVRIAQDITLPPDNKLRLASTVEHFFIPHDLAMEVKDKSTLVRCGLTVQNTHADPGWRGYLTLELVNHGTEDIVLLAGDPVAQVIFVLLDEPTERPYRGEYQDQSSRPVRPRRETVETTNG